MKRTLETNIAINDSVAHFLAHPVCQVRWYCDAVVHSVRFT